MFLVNHLNMSHIPTDQEKVKNDIYDVQMMMEETDNLQYCRFTFEERDGHIVPKMKEIGFEFNTDGELERDLNDKYIAILFQ